jgi:hypothetical protein
MAITSPRVVMNCMSERWGRYVVMSSALVSANGRRLIGALAVRPSANSTCIVPSRDICIASIRSNGKSFTPHYASIQGVTKPEFHADPAGLPRSQQTKENGFGRSMRHPSATVPVMSSLPSRLHHRIEYAG